VDQALETVWVRDRSRILATLIGVLRDFDLAEDALQDAVASATVTWAAHGVPVNPAGWLVTTARRKAIDRLRSTSASERRQRAWGELAIAWDIGDGIEPIPDDRLRLIFTCCHSALTLDAQVALTLRTLGGLSTEDVAKAFLISGPALAQRIVRAKRKIREAGIAYRVPSPDELPDRLGAVMAVITLIFNAGYLAPRGTALVNVDLCDEAMRLVTVVIDLLPEQKEIADMGGTMRLGADPVKLHDATRARELYGEQVIYERHRHRYEVNNHLRKRLEGAGLIFSGTSPDERLVEVIELSRDEHPFFVASQYHPEFKSRPERPAPLFREFVGAALAQAEPEDRSSGDDVTVSRAGAS